MAKGAAGGLLALAAVAAVVFGAATKDNRTPTSPSPPPAVARLVTAPSSSTAPTPAPPTLAPTAPTVAPLPPPVAPAASLKARPRLIISGHDVPMRVDPEPKARIIDRLSQGLAVEEIDRADGWVKVRYPLTTAQGWVKVSLTRPAIAEGETKPATAKPKPPAAPAIATAVVVARIIAASRADYPGNCACPDDHDKRGHRCGGRSAYSRPGGYAPLCYPKDVTAEMIAEFRRTHTADAQ